MNQFISINQIVNLYNSLGYIFKYLVDDDNSAKNVAKRYITNNISTLEENKIKRLFNLKDGEDFPAPYQLLGRNQHQDITNYYHIYFIKNLEYNKRTGFLINNIFEGDIPTKSIFVNYENFTLDTENIKDIFDEYIILFKNLYLSFFDNNSYRDKYTNTLFTGDYAICDIMALCFMSQAIPEESYNKIREAYKTPTAHEKLNYPAGTYADYDKLFEKADKIRVLSHNLYINFKTEGDIDLLHDTLSECNECSWSIIGL